MLSEVCYDLNIPDVVPLALPPPAVHVDHVAAGPDGGAGPAPQSHHAPLTVLLADTFSLLLPSS